MGMGRTIIDKSTATSTTARQIKTTKVLTQLALSAPSVEKFVLIDVPQDARIAMKKLTAHATTIPISVQLAMLNVFPRNIRR